MAARTSFCVFIWFVKTVCMQCAGENVSSQSLNWNQQINTTMEYYNNDSVVSVFGDDEWRKNCSLTKHKSFCDCDFAQLAHLYSDEYVMTNGTLYVEFLNETFNESFYEVVDNNPYVCFPDEEEPPHSNKTALHYITIIGMGISVAGLFLHLIYFAIVPQARNMPGCCLASLCLSLLIGYLSFLLGFEDVVSSRRTVCVASALISHFFTLSSLMWMDTIACSIYMAIFHSTSKLMVPLANFSRKQFCIFGAYSWGISFIFTAAALICDNVQGVPERYKPHFANDRCWFNTLPSLLAFFVIPGFIIIVLNAIIFILSVYKIWVNRMESGNAQQNRTKKYLVMFSKLALVMGALWISGFAALITDNIVLWYIFGFSNAFQGLFISLAFTSVRKLKRHLFSKLHMSGYESSSSTLRRTSTVIMLFRSLSRTSASK